MLRSLKSEFPISSGQTTFGTTNYIPEKADRSQMGDNFHSFPIASKREKVIAVPTQIWGELIFGVMGKTLVSLINSILYCGYNRTPGDFRRIGRGSIQKTRFGQREGIGVRQDLENCSPDREIGLTQVPQVRIIFMEYRIRRERSYCRAYGVKSLEGKTFIALDNPLSARPVKQEILTKMAKMLPYHC